MFSSFEASSLSLALRCFLSVISAIFRQTSVCTSSSILTGGLGYASCFPLNESDMFNVACLCAAAEALLPYLRMFVTATVFRFFIFWAAAAAGLSNLSYVNNILILLI